MSAGEVAIDSFQLPSNNAARLFGHDVFLSFALGSPPRGTRDYASDLARRLRERDLVVFYSEESLAPGSPLSPTLTAALQSSKALVLVLNAATVDSPRWLRTELETFRSHDPTRPVVAISLDGALSDTVLASPAAQWLAMQGQVWLDDAAGAATSDAVIDGICRALTHQRRNRLWRWAQGLLITLLSGLSVGLGWSAWRATASATEALLSAREATAERVAGSASGVLAGTRFPESFANGSETAILLTLASNKLYAGRSALDQLGATLASHEHLDWLDTSDPLALTTAFTPDSRRLLQGSLSVGSPRPNGRAAQSQYWIRDVKSGVKLTVPGSHDRSLHASGVHPDSHIGALGDDRGRVLWVDMATGLAMRSPQETGLDGIRRLVFLPGHQGLWAADRHRLVHIAAEGAVTDLSLPLALGHLKDGAGEDQFAVAGCTAPARLIQALPNGHIEDRLLAPGGTALLLPGPAADKPVTSLSADCKGERIVAYMKGQVQAWQRHAQGWRRTWRWPSDSGLPADIKARVYLSADGRRALLAVNEKLLTLDAANGKRVGDVLPLHTDAGLVSLAPNGERAVLTTGGEGLSKKLDQRTVRLTGTEEDASLICADGVRHDGAITALVISPMPHATAYTAGADGQIKRCSLYGDASAQSVRAAQSGLLRLQLDDVNQTLLALANDGTLSRWTVPDLKPLPAPPRGDWGRNLEVASFSNDGRYLATQTNGGAADAGFAVWQVATGRRVNTLRDTPQPASIAHTFALAFSPDGRTLALGEAGSFGDSRQALTLWPLRGTEVRRPLAGEPPLMVAAVNFSAEGRRVAIAGEHHPFVYEPHVNGRWHTLDQRSLSLNGPTALAFAPHSDNWIALVDEHRVYYWRVDTGGSTYEELPERLGKPTAMAFAPDGQRLLLGTDKGRLLSVAPAWSWVDALCAKVLNANLTARQWAEAVSPRLSYEPQCLDAGANGPVQIGR